jgi:hypothetical protein
MAMLDSWRFQRLLLVLVESPPFYPHFYPSPSRSSMLLERAEDKWYISYWWRKYYEPEKTQESEQDES